MVLNFGETMNSLELELQVVGNHLISAWGTELQSSSKCHEQKQIDPNSQPVEEDHLEGQVGKAFPKAE